jgi:hypothetical protein
MNAKSFGLFLESFSETLDRAGAAEQAYAWRLLLPIFQAKPSAGVGTLCKSLAGIHCSDHGSGHTVEYVLELIPFFQRCLNHVAKKDSIADIKTFADALTPFARLPIVDVAAAAVARLSQPAAAGRLRSSTELDADLVQIYVSRLQESLGNESTFLEVFNELKKDRAMKAGEVKRLAREFAKGAAKTKGDAFDLIWGRHASLMGAAAKAKSTGGRTAA